MVGWMIGWIGWMIGWMDGVMDGVADCWFVCWLIGYDIFIPPCSEHSESISIHQYVREHTLRRITFQQYIICYLLPQ